MHKYNLTVLYVAVSALATLLLADYGFFREMTFTARVSAEVHLGLWP